MTETSVELWREMLVRLADCVVVVHRGFAGRIDDADQAAEPVVDVGDVRVRGAVRQDRPSVFPCGDEPEENPAMARTPIASRSMKARIVSPLRRIGVRSLCRREPWTLPGFQRRISSRGPGQS